MGMSNQAFEHIFIPIAIVVMGLAAVALIASFIEDRRGRR